MDGTPEEEKKSKYTYANIKNEVIKKIDITATLKLGEESSKILRLTQEKATQAIIEKGGTQQDVKAFDKQFSTYEKNGDINGIQNLLRQYGLNDTLNWFNSQLQQLLRKNTESQVNLGNDLGSQDLAQRQMEIAKRDVEEQKSKDKDIVEKGKKD